MLTSLPWDVGAKIFCAMLNNIESNRSEINLLKESVDECSPILPKNSCLIAFPTYFSANILYIEEILEVFKPRGIFPPTSMR